MAEFIKKLFLKFRRFITFGIIGCVNTLLDFSVFTLCYGILHLSPALSQAAGYGSGVICSFILNRRFTFREWTRELRLQILAFLLVNGLSFYASAMSIDWLISRDVSVYIAKPAVTLLVMLINYFGYKALVFRVQDT